MLANRRYCYPLTLTNFASRYLIACEGLSTTKEQYAFTVFERVFTEFGLPRAMRTDYGSEFPLAFKLAVEAEGIRHRHIKPRRPQQNGKMERSHRMDAEEFWGCHDFETGNDAEEPLRVGAHLQLRPLLASASPRDADGETPRTPLRIRPGPAGGAFGDGRRVSEHGPFTGEGAARSEGRKRQDVPGPDLDCSVQRAVGR
jgi:transposase InsO family protein